MSNHETVRRCPACGSDATGPAEEYRGYLLAVCAGCGLTFTLNPDYSPERYMKSWDAPDPGGSGGSGFSYYPPVLSRVQTEARALWLPPPWLSPSESCALSWLRTRAPRGASVVDCGCGSGRFLRALKRHGYNAIGIDVSEALVAALQELGLDARREIAPDFTWAGRAPYAITLFEVLEHFPDPYWFVSALGARFPESHIIASVPSPMRPCLSSREGREDSDYPPHHYLRWTPDSLKLFFQGAGFPEVSIFCPCPSGHELIRWGGAIRSVGQKLVRRGVSAAPADGAAGTPRQSAAKNDPQTGRARATAQVWAARSYHALLDTIGLPLAYYHALKGRSSISFLAVASRSCELRRDVEAL